MIVRGSFSTNDKIIKSARAILTPRKKYFYFFDYTE